MMGEDILIIGQEKKIQLDESDLYYATYVDATHAKFSNGK